MGKPAGSQDDHFGRTLEEVAAEWSRRTGKRVTSQYINKVCRQALKKIRDALLDDMRRSCSGHLTEDGNGKSRV